jgi:adenylate kinase family enzyme
MTVIKKSPCLKRGGGFLLRGTMAVVMQRIVIVGSGGSGKSTLAKEIGAVLSLDVVYLDRLLWKPGWVRLSPQEQEAVIALAVSGPSWIVEGDHIRTQPLRFEASDTIIFLDLPKWICLWRTVERFVLNYGQSRLGMAEGCPERLNWTLLKWVWRYPLDNRAQVISNIEQYASGRKVIVLGSSQEVKQFLSQLTRGA